jgi:hypothetical protein
VAHCARQCATLQQQSSAGSPLAHCPSTVQYTLMYANALHLHGGLDTHLIKSELVLNGFERDTCPAILLLDLFQLELLLQQPLQDSPSTVRPSFGREMRF